VKHPTLDAHEIAPNLWQGGAPPYGTAVAEGGFDVLVLCAREIQPPSVYFPDVQVIHAPNDDHPAFGHLTKNKLQTAISAARRVASAVQEGKKVLVTCAAGLNRSGLVTSIALHMLYGWPGSQCIQTVRANRGSVNGMIPLSNDEFARALDNLTGQG